MWIVPSRGRPHLAQRLFDTGFRHKGVLIVDEDEERLYSVVRLPFGWKRMVLPRLCLSQKMNAAFDAYPDEPWYGNLNDDHLPITIGWERAVIEAAGTRSMAWPDDNYAQRISTPVKGGELCRALGWYCCPRMKHFWLDDAEELLAEAVGGHYLPDIVVSHEHVNAGRMPMDRTYRERPSNLRDKVAFEAWKRDEWPALEARLTAGGFCGNTLAESTT